MGFNKRNITKDNILYYLKNENIDPLIRDIKINQLFKADALIFDHWSSNFYNDLNPNERSIRKNLLQKYLIDSYFVDDNDFKNLNSLSESLISLCGINPTWVDVFMTSKKLDIRYSSEEQGRFDLMRNKCIDSIIDHFEK